MNVKKFFDFNNLTYQRVFKATGAAIPTSGAANISSGDPDDYVDVFDKDFSVVTAKTADKSEGIMIEAPIVGAGAIPDAQIDAVKNSLASWIGKRKGRGFKRSKYVPEFESGVTTDADGKKTPYFAITTAPGTYTVEDFRDAFDAVTAWFKKIQDESKPATKKPDDGKKKPADSGKKKPADSGKKKPDDGKKKPDDGKKKPADSGKKKPDDGKKKSGDGKKPDGGKKSDNGKKKPAEVHWDNSKTTDENLDAIMGD